MSRRKQIFVSIFLGLCVLLGMAAVNIDIAGAAPVTQSSGDWTPSDGWRSNGKCYHNVAHVGVVEQACGDWQPVPQPVRQCAAAVVIAGLSAFLTGVPVNPAMGTTAGGCLAGIF